ADVGTIRLVPVQSQLSVVDVVYNKGYYNESRRLSTGSVARVSAEEIARQPIGNPLLALQGRLPGVEIMQTSGVPGRPVEITIRGRDSIANGNDPLYLVDGVPWLNSSLTQVNGTIGGTSPFNSLSPEDIESVEVLKDADATAIYGSRGANGVILITTKKG